jgi:hypothetical protein
MALNHGYFVGEPTTFPRPPSPFTSSLLLSSQLLSFYHPPPSIINLLTPLSWSSLAITVEQPFRQLPTFLVRHIVGMASFDRKQMRC